MPLKIAQLGQPVLRTVAQPVPLEEIQTPEFQEFLDSMEETMRKAPGVGLAAPQVFESRRVFLAAILPPPAKGEFPGIEVFINPTLSELSDEYDGAWEGCLSFIELLVVVPRHRRLKVDYYNRNGEPRSMELAGFPARVVQHEYDHLDGILTIDRAIDPRHIIKASEVDDAVVDFDGEDEDDLEEDDNL